MGISLSGGPYSYNRFDAYEQLIAEKQGYNDREDESLGERDGKESTKKQSKKDRRDEAKGEAKSEGKPDYIDIDKDGDKEESMKKAAKEAKNEQMDYYTSVLSRLAGTYHPHDPAKDVAPLQEKESTAERKSAADRGFEKKRQEKEGKYGEAHETGEIMKLQDKKLSEASGAGSPGKMAASVKKEAESNKKETDAMAFASKKQRRQQAVNAAEQFVMESLIEDGLANNMVSAETIMLHMSDEWFDSIIAEMGPAFPSETKAQAKAQSDHREGKSAKGEKTGKNPGPKMSHTSGYNRQD